MIYKLVTNKTSYLTEDNRKPLDSVIFPKKISKFRFWLWLFNPKIKVYVHFNYNWELAFNGRYRNLLT